MDEYEEVEHAGLKASVWGWATLRFVHNIHGSPHFRLERFMQRVTTRAMNIELARQLWNMGGGHVLGAEAVVRRAQDWAREIQAEDPEKAIFNGKYSASIYLLLGYAFELLLKAAFVAHEGDPGQLGVRGIGHDLGKALTSAQERGFQSAAPNLVEIVDLLRMPHLQHQFRYGGMDNFPLPANVDAIVASLNHLAAELQALLYPDGR